MYFDIPKYTKGESGFHYDQIFQFDECDISRYATNIAPQFANLAKAWDIQKNSEWSARCYLSVKMLLASTIFLTSYEFASTRNLQLVEPYLLYYAALNSCRAFVLTLPWHGWAAGKLHRLEHQKIINITVDAINKIDSSTAKFIKLEMQSARSYRELYSYHFPSSGLHDFNKVYFDNIVKLCKVLAEVSQFNSEILDFQLTKRLSIEPGIDSEIFKHCAIFKTADGDIYDEEDSYRIGYICRKMKRPYNLYWFATGGLVEDFFGAWCARDDDDDSTMKDIYNPDIDWRIIFSFS